MKLVISRVDLLNIIGRVQTVIPNKPSVPILSSLVLEAVDDQLILSATDLMVSGRVFSKAQIEEEGAIVLPARKFFQLIRELTASQVEIHTSGEIVCINAGTSHFKMSGISKSAYPELPDLSGGISVMIDNNIFREMLVRSSFSAARDDNRQVLNGILFQYRDRVATVVGTDGKRLARLFTDVTTPSFSDTNDQLGSYILPLRAVEEMIKLLEIKDHDSRLTFLPDRVGVEIENVLLITKLLKGHYPDVNEVIPQKAAEPIILHREELISLLRQVSLFTKDYSSAIQFTFMPGALHLTAAHREVGEGKACMEVNYGGPKLDVAFNPHYFLDVLRHSKDESVQLSLFDTYSPGLITDSSNAHFVLMPMHLEAKN